MTSSDIYSYYYQVILVNFILCRVLQSHYLWVYYRSIIVIISILLLSFSLQKATIWRWLSLFILLRSSISFLREGHLSIRSFLCWIIDGDRLKFYLIFGFIIICGITMFCIFYRGIWWYYHDHNLIWSYLLLIASASIRRFIDSYISCSFITISWTGILPLAEYLTSNYRR